MVIPAWFGGNGEGGEEEEEPHGCLEHGADNIIAGLVGGREVTAPGIYFAKQSQLWGRGLGLFVQNVFARGLGVFRGGGTKASRAGQGVRPTCRVWVCLCKSPACIQLSKSVAAEPLARMPPAAPLRRMVTVGVLRNRANSRPRPC